MPVQEKRVTNDLTDLPSTGRMLAIDPGTKRVGVAVCDEARIVTTPLPRIDRGSWKDLLSEIDQLLQDFDAVALVVGLPLESDGSESEMSREAREMARKFALSLDVPVLLQDERVTSYEAKRRLWLKGVDPNRSRELVDSEAAAVILSDFLARLGEI